MLAKETRYLNSLFSDPYDDALINKEINENYKVLKRKKVYKHVRNDSLDSLLDFTEHPLLIR